MADTQFQRRLSAILSADAQGYSRLMGTDDVATVHRIKACRDIMYRLIEANNGRVVDAPGDNLLAEFASVVDAVDCALNIQTELAEFNRNLRDDEQMHFRIGVTIGDLISDEGRIYGDGVNIAARLEKLAEPGGVCISSAAYEQAQGKLAMGCEYMGEQDVKNIERPVPAYRVWKEEQAVACDIPPRKGLKRRQPWRNLVPIAATIIMVVLAVTLYMRKQSPPPLSNSVPATPSESNEAASIAVLPFINLGTDKTREYFSDGITRDLITDLSKFSGLNVAAAGNVFKYKGKHYDISKISSELGVRYLLEGSVQTDEQQVRINAQLIDSESGHPIWAERYEEGETSIFTLQSRIIEAIVRRLALRIDEAERARAFKKAPVNLQAYDYLLRGRHLYLQRNREANQEARVLFKKALALEPDYVDAYVYLARSRTWDVMYGWTEFPYKAFDMAHEYAKKAVGLDPSNDEARAALGYIYMRQGKYELAIAELERAIELNPNDWPNYRYMGAVMLYTGNPEEAIRWYETSMTYDPYLSPGSFMNVGIAHFVQNRTEEAERWLRQCTSRWPDFLGCHIILTAVYGQTDRIEKAKEEATMLKRLSPLFKTEFYGIAFRNADHRNKIIDGLHLAGLD